MIKQEKCEELRKMFESGKTVKDIAMMERIFVSTVLRAIVRAGGVVPLTEGRRFTTMIVKEWVDLYQRGKSISEIAQKYSTSAGVIQNRMMADFGVVMRRTRIFTEEHKQNLSESCKGRISHQKGKPLAEEQKQKIRESVQKTMRTPEMRQYISKVMKGKLTGDKHPAWRGGISQKYVKGYKNKYPATFNKELRLIILSRDTHICQHCKCTDDLTVHHIDYDKHNNDISNLIACCRSCNGKFNVNREQWAAYWKEYQQNRVIGR
jgi:hypothetical protein